MIKLGNKIKSTVTGFEGVTTSKSISLSGSEQYNIRPHGLNRDGDSITGIWYDIQEVELIDVGIFNGKINELPHSDIELGDDVEHISGFTGTVVERIEYMNGCLYFGVLPKMGKDGKLPDTEYLPCQYLSVKDSENKKIKPSSTGGASSSAPMM